VINASCHCGDVHLKIAAAPEEVTDCNCSICRRYSVLWAYYPVDDVRVAASSGATDLYMWNGRSIAFHRCATCGCVTHWSAVDRRRPKMGVNARLMEPEILARARVRRLDGAATGRYFDE
jgi:hypothetical protein